MEMPTVVVPLKFPLEIDGKTIASVTVRRPKAKDMIALGDHMPALMKLDPEAGAGSVVLDASVFRAMTEVAAELADLGEYARELDFIDLFEIATKALSAVGEAAGSGGAAPTGEPR